MKLVDILQENVFDLSNPEHKRMLVDLDGFTASPNERLRDDTLKYLLDRAKKLSKRKNVTLYRVLYTDDDTLDGLAKRLGVKELKVGEHVTHKSDRPTSWTYSWKAAEEILDSDDVEDHYGIIISAEIPDTAVVLDLEDLSKEEQKHIYIFYEQKEVIVAPGNYSAEVSVVEDRARGTKL